MVQTEDYLETMYFNQAECGIRIWKCGYGINESSTLDRCPKWGTREREKEDYLRYLKWEQTKKELLSVSVIQLRIGEKQGKQYWVHQQITEDVINVVTVFFFLQQ